MACEEDSWGLREYVASNVAVPEELRPQRVAVLCVGNRLMLDDGVGPAVYDELTASYDIPDNVELLDLGCLSLAMIDRVREFDVILTVDAVDDSGQPAGTVLRYAPDAMARHVGITASLHDLKLIDLFDSAALLGYQAEGLCLGMQVENASPAEATEGLTRPVHDALPLLVDVVVGELARLGFPLSRKASIIEWSVEAYLLGLKYRGSGRPLIIGDAHFRSEHNDSNWPAGEELFVKRESTCSRLLSRQLACKNRSYLHACATIHGVWMKANSFTYGGYRV